jgi:hypothetical protein
LCLSLNESPQDDEQPESACQDDHHQMEPEPASDPFVVSPHDITYTNESQVGRSLISPPSIRGKR